MTSTATPTGISDEVQELIDELTLEEKCQLVVGKDSWIVNGCERLGIPEWTTSDGPVGVRGRQRGPGLVVPGPSALAATWDLDLVEEIGVALGTECLDRRVDLLLGPTTNMHRSPRGGRHFESFSEDPFLSTRLGVSYIRGVQSKGVGACIKHFVANDQETERMSINVEVDEPTLREVYLAPFEAAVKEVGVRAVMGAYNAVNGDQSCAHPDLLVGVLKEEWGFDGLVVSDWAAIKDTVAPALHGMDLEMPAPTRFWGEGKLAAAVERGDVDVSLIDDKVARILTFLEWRGRLGTPSDHEEESIERPEHRVLARRAATESIVLVRNERDVLPLARNRTVALIGPAAASTAIQGGGSANLDAHRSPNLLGSLAERVGGRFIGHARGTDMRRLPRRVPTEWLDGDEAVTIEVFDSIGFDGPIFETKQGRETRAVYLPGDAPSEVSAISIRETVMVVPPVAGSYSLAGIGIGHIKMWVDGDLVSDSDEHDFTINMAFAVAPAVVAMDEVRPYEIRIEVTSHDDAPAVFGGVDVRMTPVDNTFEDECAAAEALARVADVAVVVVGTTPEWESEGEDRADLELPGRQNELIARVAAANPDTVVVLNCGAPTSMPWFDDVAGVLLGWYPGQEGAEALTDVLTGAADPGGRMPTTWAKSEADTPSYGNFPGSDGVVEYAEGLFVGHRHYDRHGIEPLIAFGHGGSYTTFEWGEPAVTGSGTSFTVDVEVRNTGSRPGTEVVQVYVGLTSVDPSLPDKVLAGFAKLHLDAGASGVASIGLAPRAFEHWDVAAHDWRVHAGNYTITVAASATDVRGTATVEVAG